MSRLDGRYADKGTDQNGSIIRFTIRGERAAVPVSGVVEHYREWIGVLSGEPERDIWRVDTPQGTCELHHLRQPTAENEGHEGTWLVFRWDD